MLQKVMHVPDLRRNLLSMTSCIQQGIDVHFCRNGAVLFLRDNEVIARGFQEGKLFFLEGTSPTNCISSPAEVFNTTAIPYDIAHARLGHPNDTVLTAIDKSVLGWSPMTSTTPTPCHACTIGKAKRPSFNQPSATIYGLAELTHSDLQGPFRIPGPRS